jgi:hypothetical protein
VAKPPKKPRTADKVAAIVATKLANEGKAPAPVGAEARRASGWKKRLERSKTTVWPDTLELWHHGLARQVLLEEVRLDPSFDPQANHRLHLGKDAVQRAGFLQALRLFPSGKRFAPEVRDQLRHWRKTAALLAAGQPVFCKVSYSAGGGIDLEFSTNASDFLPGAAIAEQAGHKGNAPVVEEDEAEGPISQWFKKPCWSPQGGGL